MSEKVIDAIVSVVLVSFVAGLFMAHTWFQMAVWCVCFLSVVLAAYVYSWVKKEK